MLLRIVGRRPQVVSFEPGLLLDKQLGKCCLVGFGHFAKVVREVTIEWFELVVRQVSSHLLRTLVFLKNDPDMRLHGLNGDAQGFRDAGDSPPHELVSG